VPLWAGTTVATYGDRVEPTRSDLAEALRRAMSGRLTLVDSVSYLCNHVVCYSKQRVRIRYWDLLAGLCLHLVRINACIRSFCSCIELGIVRVRRLGYGCHSWMRQTRMVGRTVSRTTLRQRSKTLSRTTALDLLIKTWHHPYRPLWATHPKRKVFGTSSTGCYELEALTCRWPAPTWGLHRTPTNIHGVGHRRERHRRKPKPAILWRSPWSNRPCA
jgi:hypothetical protein